MLDEGSISGVIHSDQLLLFKSPLSSPLLRVSIGSDCSFEEFFHWSSGRTLGGLVLEAPFLDIHQALLTHWLSLVIELMLFFPLESRSS